MIPTKRVGLLAGAAALTLTGGGFADNTNEELRARVAELESRLAAVEAEESDQWLTEQRAGEIRGLVQDVLADADTRASLLAQGMTAGYQDGAVISSPDGNWMLRTNIHMQQRFVYNNIDDAGIATLDDDRWSFENTRTKFILSGNVVSPEWFYLVDINVGSAEVFEGTGIDIDGDGEDDIFTGSEREGVGNAYLGYDYGNGLKVMLGTFKAPLLREELVDSRYQLALERSLVNYFYTGGYTDGIAFDYLGDQFHFIGSYNDGANTGQSTWSTADTDFAFTVRGEWMAMGTWDQFMDFTSPSGEETGLLIGGALHYQSLEDDPGTGLADIETVTMTVDASYEFGGGNLFGAFIYNTVDLPAGFSDADQTGLVLQGGYYLTDNWEGFLRYEYSDFDITGIDDINIVTLGVNRYFAGHNAKWTTDIGIGFDPVIGVSAVAGGASPITGYRADARDEDSQVVIRTQLQIVF
ncbi:MAG: porin [Planctomycetota bacterium]|jgi:hypothetical protein